MEERDCLVCQEWDSNFCGSDQKSEGMCERTGNFTPCYYYCDRFTLKYSIRFTRIKNTIKMFVYKMVKKYIKFRSDK